MSWSVLYIVFLFFLSCTNIPSPWCRFHSHTFVLQEVSLIQEKLTRVPSDVTKFSHLELLCLRQNYIKEITFVAGLTTIQELDFHDNLLKKIEGLEKLVNLT